MKSIILLFLFIAFATITTNAQNKVSVIGYGGSAFANSKVGFDFGLGVSYNVSKIFALSLSGEALSFKKQLNQEFKKVTLNAEFTPKHKSSTFLSSNIGTSVLSSNNISYIGLDIGLKLNQKISEKLSGCLWVNTNFNKALNGIIQSNICLKYRL